MRIIKSLGLSVCSFVISVFLTGFLIDHNLLFIRSDSFSPSFFEIITAFLHDLFTDWVYILVMFILGLYAYSKRHAFIDAPDINIIGKTTDRTYIVIGIFLLISSVIGPYFPLLGLFSAMVFPVYCFFVTYYLLRKRENHGY